MTNFTIDGLGLDLLMSRFSHRALSLCIFTGKSHFSRYFAVSDVQNVLLAAPEAILCFSDGELEISGKQRSRVDGGRLFKTMHSNTGSILSPSGIEGVFLARERMEYLYFDLVRRY